MVRSSRAFTLEEEVAIVKRAIALRQAGRLEELTGDRSSNSSHTLYRADGRTMNVHGLARLVAELEHTPADPLEQTVRELRRGRDRGGRDVAAWRNRRQRYMSAKGAARC